ncbi:Lrp/AsnC family transcriptional regulator [Streptomyces sp. NPDC048419]|uniref:Lrp/AsnC family transcriptional regulator n=1 Tax=Streptomyces sp. NPDC048419 TaxID=3365547 RepID=UPI0037172398
MDDIDREILSALQEDARISFRDLGQRVGLSANAATDRVRKLRRTGVIRGFTTLVDLSARDRDGLVIFIDARLRPDTTDEAFEKAVVQLPGITEVIHVTGEHDYLIRARVADASGLDAVVRSLKHRAGVARTSTRLALRVVLD